MSLTDYLENNVVNWMRGTAMPAAPATLYLALFTAAPGETGGGTEVSGGAYARQTLTLGAPAAGVSVSTNTINFPVATANWGTILYVAIFDALAAGNMLAYQQLSAPDQKAININDQAQFASGTLTFTLD
jgi:hypothetical protein